MTKKKIIFAAGGTGGHLFPAQALAKDLQSKGYEILFAGGRLSTNPFFHQETFSFKEIRGASPFRSNPIFAMIQLMKGTIDGIKLLNEFVPDCIVGFGSYYSFPILLGAKLKKIPFFLVESNAFPGRVNRLFAKDSVLNALQFEETIEKLKGKGQRVQIPIWAQSQTSEMKDPAEARTFFDLDPAHFTLLIVGGSGGAAGLNQVASFLTKEMSLQVIHMCGKNQNREALEKIYRDKGVRCCVKYFEERMDIAFLAADLVLSRAGAGIINELVFYEKPSILVPWPGATDHHQMENALAHAKDKGAVILPESEISSFPKVFFEVKSRLQEMQHCISLQKASNLKQLSEQIEDYLAGEI